MAISTEQWQMTANMLLCGHTNGAVGMVVGISPTYISEMRNKVGTELYEFLTVGMKIKPSDYAKASIHHLSVNSKSDVVRMSAATSMLGWDDGTVTTDDNSKSDAQIVAAIRRELDDI